MPYLPSEAELEEAELEEPKLERAKLEEAELELSSSVNTTKNIVLVYTIN